MTNEEWLRKFARWLKTLDETMEESELADFLCAVADAPCSRCKYNNEQPVANGETCAAITWLHEVRR